MQQTIDYIGNIGLIIAPPDWRWWVLIWVSLPLVITVAAWLVARCRCHVPESGAWNTCGRLWRGIGLALFGAVILSYLIAVYLVPENWTVNLSNIPDGFGGTTLIFMRENKEWFCGILPTVAWVVFAWLFFIIPGGKIAKAKLGIR
ncbi:MAG: hypothetical protein FWG50_03460 [Kiritimatiellaeota bacterium]|nr:hypothetical protein [Kiritimatiellota bacterium]